MPLLSPLRVAAKYHLPPHAAKLLPACAFSAVNRKTFLLRRHCARTHATLLLRTMLRAEADACLLRGAAGACLALQLRHFCCAPGCETAAGVHMLLLYRLRLPLGALKLARWLLCLLPILISFTSSISILGCMLFFDWFLRHRYILLIHSVVSITDWKFFLESCESSYV